MHPLRQPEPVKAAGDHCEPEREHAGYPEGSGRGCRYLSAGIHECRAAS